MFKTSEVSTKILNIPAPTLRRYTVDFSEHLSESANLSGKDKRYTPEDTNVLKRARKLLQSGRNVAEVNELLNHPEGVTSTLSLVPEISSDINNINTELEITNQEIANIKNFNANLADTVLKLTEEMSELKNTNKELLETNRRLNENERRINELEFNRKTLFQRVFKL